MDTISDVNFSMETAHRAKDRIQQDAAAAIPAQANKAQEGWFNSSLLRLLNYFCHFPQYFKEKKNVQKHVHFYIR